MLPFNPNQHSQGCFEIDQSLENTRKPVLLEATNHTYEDTYALVKFVTNSDIASYTNDVRYIRIDQNTIDRDLHWVNYSYKTVSLQFMGNVYADFIKEVQVEVFTSETITESEI